MASWTVSTDASRGDRVTTAVVGASTLLTPEGFDMAGIVRGRVKPNFRSSFDAFREEEKVGKRVEVKGISGAADAEGGEDDWAGLEVRVVERGENENEEEEEVVDGSPPALSSAAVDR